MKSKPLLWRPHTVRF